MLSVPLLLPRPPATGNFKGEANAPAVFWVENSARSASNSASVGIRNPLGHGLLTPLATCHKLSFGVANQLYGAYPAAIKLPCYGVLVVARVGVVALTDPVVLLVQVTNSCPSAFLPHWNKEPYAKGSADTVACCPTLKLAWFRFA